jgi:hypothetical protein
MSKDHDSRASDGERIEDVNFRTLNTAPDARFVPVVFCGDVLAVVHAADE